MTDITFGDVNGKVPVIVGACNRGTKNTVILVRIARDCDAEAVIVEMPYILTPHALKEALNMFRPSGWSSWKALTWSKRKRTRKVKTIPLRQRPNLDSKIRADSILEYTGYSQRRDLWLRLSLS